MIDWLSFMWGGGFIVLIVSPSQYHDRSTLLTHAMSDQPDPTDASTWGLGALGETRAQNLRAVSHSILLSKPPVSDNDTEAHLHRWPTTRTNGPAWLPDRQKPIFPSSNTKRNISTDRSMSLSSSMDVWSPRSRTSMRTSLRPDDIVPQREPATPTVSSIPRHSAPQVFLESSISQIRPSLLASPNRAVTSSSSTSPPLSPVQASPLPQRHLLEQRRGSDSVSMIHSSIWSVSHTEPERASFSHALRPSDRPTTPAPRSTSHSVSSQSSAGEAGAGITAQQQATSMMASMNLQPNLSAPCSPTTVAGPPTSRRTPVPSLSLPATTEVAPSPLSPSSIPPEFMPEEGYVGPAQTGPPVADGPPMYWHYAASIGSGLGPNPMMLSLPMPARAFVIKSFTEVDIQRSLRFGVWTSTEKGNNRLDRAWQKSSSLGPIYLFFSVNGSGLFCGVAQMMSGLDYTKNTDIWAEGNRWKGLFHVRWLIVKDIPNSQLRHILLYSRYCGCAGDD